MPHPPEGEIDENEWLEPDHTPWLNEMFSLPPERKYDPVTARLLEAAHAAEYMTNHDIEKLNGDFYEVLLAVTAILLANGMSEAEAREQIHEWEIFRANGT